MQIHAPCLTEAYLDHNLYLGLDLLTSGSMAAEFLPWTISLPTLVLIARAVFLLEQGQTDRQTDRQTEATERLIHHACGYRLQRA